MSSSTSDIILEKVVPAFGAIIATLMYVAPVPSVLKAHKLQAIGDLNATPLAVTIMNTIIWLTYGCIKKDIFVASPNVAGIGLAVWCTVTVFSLTDEQVRSQLRHILVVAAVLLPLLAAITSFAAGGLQMQLSVWGVAGNLIALLYYGAPLSTMKEVIRMRNSASILLPLTIMNSTNACLWLVYGIAVHDPFIWLPNGIGLLLSVAQLVLRAIYPPHAKPPSLSPSKVNSELQYARMLERVDTPPANFDVESKV